MANIMQHHGCPSPMKAISNGVFQGPLRQPRVIVEIIGGILLGPLAFGRNHYYLHAVFPARSITVLDTLANLSLLFFLFLVGLKLVPKSIQQTGKNALGIAIAGRIAMSAAAVSDVATWILLAISITQSGFGNSPLISLWVLLSGITFIICVVLVLRLILSWVACRSEDGEPGALVEKVEDIFSGLFLPLYFVSSGLKTNIATISGAQSWGLLVLVIVTACIGKIMGTVLVSIACRVPIHEALALGFLMNTKGLVELIDLNIGKDQKVFNDQTFAIMVLMALFTTFITTPLVTAIYKPARKANAPYKHRTIQRQGPHSQLWIMTCFHSTKNIPTLINLIEASRGTARRSMLCFYAMHLMELSERSSPILMVQKA